MPIHMYIIGFSMKSLTIDNKQKVLDKQFQSGEQHKRGNGYTRQRMCNMVSNFIHVVMSHCKLKDRYIN